MAKKVLFIKYVCETCYEIAWGTFQKLNFLKRLHTNHKPQWHYTKQCRNTLWPVNQTPVMFASLIEVPVCRQRVIHVCKVKLNIPRVQTGSRLPGKVPLSGTFPGNPTVWTLAGTSPGGPTKHVGSREGESDLGLVIDIAQLFFIKCAHAPNVVALWSNTQPKPLSRDCPRKVGAFENTVWTVGRKKDKTTPNCPPVNWTQSERRDSLLNHTWKVKSLTYKCIQIQEYILIGKLLSWQTHF